MAVPNLPFIQQQMIRYGMTVYLALGLFGNICNCIIFTRHSHRRAASSIYFLSLSTIAIIYLLWAIIPYLYTLNHTDPQRQSLLYCKVKNYVAVCLSQCLRYTVVFVCADRFVVTRTNVRIRSLSSVSIAIKLVLIMCAVWLVASIHVLILMDIRSGVCGMFGVYKLIYAIYQITSVAILPPVLMSIFSILTIRSLYQRHVIQTRARKRDRYLMRMVVAEVIVNIFTSIPFSINLFYGAVTYYVVDKRTKRLEIESFISFLTAFLVYLISVAPFYLFVLTSKPFRNEFFNIFITCWDKYILRRVRIVPLTGQTKTATTNGTPIHDGH
jgi:hypothetical protein